MYSYTNSVAAVHFNFNCSVVKLCSDGSQDFCFLPESVNNTWGGGGKCGHNSCVSIACVGSEQNITQSRYSEGFI